MRSTLLVLFLGLSLAPYAGNLPMTSPEGFWKGTITSDGVVREINLEVKVDNDTHYVHWSIPETGFMSYRNTLIEEGNYWKTADEMLVFELGKNGIEGHVSIHGFRGVLTLEKASKPKLNYSIEVVRFGTISLEGELLIPEGNGPFPAIIFVHGSGNGNRNEWRMAAERLVKIGFACLIYDKRGSGNSGGSWIKASLSDLANDVAEGIEFLESKDFVDKSRTGLYGHSQGGWVISRAATISNKIDFAIAVNGGGITPKASEIASYRQEMHAGELSKSEEDDANSLINQYFDWLGSGLGRVELIERAEESASETWYKYVPIGRVIPSTENRINWEWVAKYDPVNDISKIDFPVLLAIGEDDFTQSDGKIIEGWSKGMMQKSGNRLDIMMFGSANHGMRIGSHAHGPIFWQPFVDGYWSAIESWLKSNIIISQK